MKYTNIPLDTMKCVGGFLQTFFTSKLTIPFFFEDGRVDDLGMNTVEIRFDGPDINHITVQEYIITLSIDLLVTMEKTQNIFTRAAVIGVCEEALREDIPLILDGILVGCLSTARPFGGTDKITTVNYGQVHKDRGVLHTSINTTLNILI